MVSCLILSCGSKSGRDKGLYFARVPSVVKNQGEEAQNISEERTQKKLQIEQTIKKRRRNEARERGSVNC